MFQQKHTVMTIDREILPFFDYTCIGKMSGSALQIRETVYLWGRVERYAFGTRIVCKQHNMLPCAFVWESVITLDFLEIVKVFGIKVCMYSHPAKCVKTLL